MYLNDKTVAASKNIKERDYWLNKFSGDLAKPGFYYDYPNNNPEDHQYDNIKFQFPGTAYSKLMGLSKQNDHTLYIILLAGVMVLLNKHTGINDIIVGTSIFKQEIEGDFINTVLALRNSIQDQMTFKEILIKAKEVFLEAMENQNYPIETLLYHLGMETSGSQFPLFDIIVLLENIHNKEYIHPIKPNMIFSFKRTPTALEGVVEYNVSLYKKDTIQRIFNHLIHLFEETLAHLDTKISDISLVTGKEKEQILFQFNKTGKNLIRDTCYHGLFEAQVGKNPHRIAAVYNAQKITYKELDATANRIAHFLWEQGIGNNHLVGLYMKRNIKMLGSIIGVYKAGAAYLPIEVDYPEIRVKYILEDSDAKLLIAGKDMTEPLDEISGTLPLLTEILYLDDEGNPGNELPGYPDTPPGIANNPDNLAYVIYTSGTTGVPKGVMIHQLGMLNHIYAKINDLAITGNDIIAQTASACFDISVWQFLALLLVGGAAHIIDKEIVFEHRQLFDHLRKGKITILESVPSLMAVFLEILENENDNKLEHLRWMIPTGEPLTPHLVRKWYKVFPGTKLVNAYGPTEASDDVTHYLVEKIPPEDQTNIPIGKPIQNFHIYILDKNRNLCPIGVRGEICAAGVGVGKGYWKDPEKTAAAFITNPLAREITDPDYQRLYRTGDIGFFKPDGNLVCLGRLDHQVKIRGNRIELGEIERQLLSHHQVEEALVIDRQVQGGGKYLCAYIVGGNGAAPQETSYTMDLREHLSQLLPEYMIPSYFVHLDKFPLTHNGKVDRKALPEPGIETQEIYAAPRNEIEQKLAEIWSEVLRIKNHQISIDANFFEIGGHSLSATLATARIHKIFEVKISLVQLFNQPTIRSLAKTIKGLAKDKYQSISPVEKKEYYLLSSAQKRLYIIQQIELDSFGYNMPMAIILQGNIEKEKFHDTFKKLINRHESLRTSFHMINESPVQKIHNKVTFEIEYYQPVKQGQEGKIINDFVRPFDLSQAPLLRVGMVQTENLENRYILIVDMHHIVSDGVSHQVLNQDFASLYAGNDSPGLKLQYKDYAEYQVQEVQKNTFKQQEAFWLKEFKEEPLPLDLPLDYKRPAIQSFEGRSTGFQLNKEQTKGLNDLASSREATLFMVLLAVYNVFLYKLSNQENIVVGTPIAGRRHADLERLIGMFVNTLALQNNLSGEMTFNRFLKNVRKKTLAAFENQDYQFEDLVEQVVSNRDMCRNPLFDVVFALQNITTAQTLETVKEEPTGDLSITPYPYEIKTSKFDMTLVALERQEELYFSFQYCTRLFQKETIERFISYFKQVISSVIENPGTKILEIDILTPGERQQILEDFNNTKPGTPVNKAAVHKLFEEQVEKTPDNIAVAAPLPGENRTYMSHISYRELNKRSRQLARVLHKKGVQPDTIVGIMVEPSIPMIVGILGILIAGGAYLPIDPDYPQDRTDFMLKDSNAKILLKGNTIGPGKSEYRISKSETNANDQNSNLAYIIYTSGSTGKPKGVMVQHSSLMNVLSALFKMYPFSQTDNYLLKTSFTFDVSASEIFGWFWGGGRLTVLGKDDHKNPQKILEAIEHSKVTHINFVPSMFGVFIDRLTHKDIAKLSSLKYIFLAGEALPPRQVKKFRQLNTQIPLENIYGPTEGTIYVSRYSLSQWDGYGNIPIGKPLQNTALYILDKNQAPVPRGVSGELCFTGHGVARGYLNNPELTAEKFCLRRPGALFINTLKKHAKKTSFWDDAPKEQHQADREWVGGATPLFEKTAPGPRKNFLLEGADNRIDRIHLSNRSCWSYALYKTGDLARWLKDHNIEFLGRIDQQVKIRGFRIELGEIETHLMDHQKVKEAVVIPGEIFEQNLDNDNTAHQYLCAYLVAKEKIDTLELKTFLSQRLPDYMVPAYITQLEKIPLTPSGKVNRKALPPPQLKPGIGHIPPRNQIEKKLAAIWSQVLGIKKNIIGIDSNFFQMGGQSLKATIMTTKLQKEFNIKVPLSIIFDNPTITRLAERIQGEAKDRYAAVEPTEKKDYHVLSSAQKRLYILHQMEAMHVTYNLPFILPLTKDMNQQKLEEIFKILIARHESLRTSYQMIHGELVQRIHEKVDFTLEYHVAPKHNVEKIMKEFVKPFDLTRPPLLRAGLVKIENSNHVLLLDMHHIITDGTSQGILINEFNAQYAGEELLPLKLHYKDYAEWQQVQLEKETLKQQEQYWLQEFSGEIPLLDLPYDFPRPSSQDFAGRTLYFNLEKEISDTLKNLELKNGITLFMLLLALYNILLAKLSGQEDIIVGTNVAGRSHADMEHIIGMFVNTLPLRCCPTPGKTFSGFLEEVKDKTLKAFENQDYQFEVLVDRLPLDKDTSRNPLFDVMFSLVEFDTTTGDSPKNKKEPEFNEYETQTSKFDLTLSAIETGKQLFFACEYCTKLFQKETIQQFIGYFKNTISVVLKSPGIKIRDIQIISPEEKNRLLVEFNDTKSGYPMDKTLHELLIRQAEKTPDNIAIIGPSQIKNRTDRKYRSYRTHTTYISYRELNQRSHQFACLLQERGIQPDTIVGITAERSVEMVMIIFGILKAGGAYLPIELDYPEERKQYMLADSSAEMLVTTSSLSEDRKVRRWQGRKVFLSATGNSPLERGGPKGRGVSNLSTLSSPSTSTLTSACQVSSTNLAYVIYTSGSTGKPKGVMLQHQNVVNYTWWAIQKYVKGERIHFPLFTSLTFDLTVTSIFTPLLSGNTLVVYRGDSRETLIEEIIEDNRIGVVKLTPSHLKLILEQKEQKGNKIKSFIKRFIVGGEDLKTRLAAEITGVFHEPPMIFNEYGPTEATVGCMTHVFSLKTDVRQSVPIGSPADNVQLYILDKSKKILPVGVLGELYISGDGLARGYLNRPLLTAERFVDNPFLQGTCMYKTGDLAKFLEDGKIEFSGRIDHQVKIRGYRLELEEIQSKLLEYKKHKPIPVIKNAVIIDKENNREEKYLAAYIVAEEELNHQELREYLAKELPDYMIPSSFVQLEKIPLTPNGKLDRKALPEPGASIDGDYIPPQDEIEKKLVHIWWEILGIEETKIGITHNFFQLGGNSLDIIRMISRINKELGIQFPVTSAFETPTIKEISKIIKSKNFAEQDILLLNQEKTEKIFCFPPQVAYGIIYQPLASVIDHYSWYAFNFIEEEDRLEKYVNKITNLQPKSPYILFGYSAGGKLTFQVAKALENNGCKVSDIIFFDCMFTEKDHRTEKEIADDFKNFLQINYEFVDQFTMAWGVPFLKEKVLEKSEKYIRYYELEPLKLEKINANLHIILSEEAQTSWDMDPKCWNKYIPEPAVIYKGFGDHRGMFSPGNLEKNSKTLREILDNIQEKNK